MYSGTPASLALPERSSFGMTMSASSVIVAYSCAVKNFGLCGPFAAAAAGFAAAGLAAAGAAGVCSAPSAIDRSASAAAGVVPRIWST
jgi:hypothetical protein